MTLTYEEFESTYRPLPMLETYGADHELVLETPETYIWTFVDGGDYSGYVPGYEKVNRLGYIICQEPWTDPTLYVDLKEVTLCDFDQHIWVDHKRYDGTPVEICSECEVDRYDYVGN